MKKFIALTALALCVPAFANVTVTADNDIKITAINGESVNQSLFQNPKQSFTVGAGQTVITARYERLFDLTRNEHDVVKSAEITLTAELANNQTYRLTMPNLPKTHSQATDFAKSPTLQLLSGNTVIAQESKGKSGGFLSGLFSKNDSQHNQVIASLPKQTSTQAVITPTAQSSNTLDNFMRLWLDASEAEREKIRQWVNK